MRLIEMTTDLNGSVVVIGDVHGCGSLLDPILAPCLGKAVKLIFLGDFDRSPEDNGDQRVLERVVLQNKPACFSR